MNKNSDILKLRIKELLSIEGRDYKWLASELGVSDTYMSGVVNGSISVGVNRLVDIARILGVEFSDLFARTRWNASSICDIGDCTGCGDDDLYYRPCTQIVEDGGAIIYKNPLPGDLAKVGIFNDTAGKNRKVSKVIGCNESDVEDIMRGKRPVSPRQWYEMCKVFGSDAYRVMPFVALDVSLAVFANDTALFNKDGELIYP